MILNRIANVQDVPVHVWFCLNKVQLNVLLSYTDISFMFVESQSNSSFKNITVNSTKNPLSNVTVRTTNSTSSAYSVVTTNSSTVKKHVHNNLLSDLARISQDSTSLKDEETGLDNNQTISAPSSRKFKSIIKAENGTFAVRKSGSSSQSLAQSQKDNKTNDRTQVSSKPSETTFAASSTVGSDIGLTGTHDNAQNGSNRNEEIGQVRLSLPTHLVLNNNTNYGKPFSKLITANEGTPSMNGEHSNDVESKTQESLAPISDRTEITPQQTQSNGLVSNSGQQDNYQTIPKETKNKANSEKTNEETLIEETSPFNSDNDTVNFKDITREYNEANMKNDSTGKK